MDTNRFNNALLNNAKIAVVLSLVFLGPTRCGHADDMRRKTKFWAQLNAPMTAVVDGMSLRDALQRVSEPVAVNLFLDRHVDPTSPIKAGSVGPTIFMAITEIAKARDCVVMPVCNVVLVGRADWVDATSASLIQASQEDTDADVVDVQWPELTSGSKALAAAAGMDSANTDSVPLPHDLWPAQTWKQIDRRVAIALVLAQFDLGLSGFHDASSTEIQASPIDAKYMAERMYSSDAHSSLLRRVIRASDAKSRAVVEDDSLRIQASTTAHRLGTDALLSQYAKVVAAQNTNETLTFSLRRTETSAGAALHQFAQAAGRQCIIEPDAIQACQQQISLEANDETLKSLINRVAQKAGVIVQWHDQKIVVTMPK